MSTLLSTSRPSNNHHGRTFLKRLLVAAFFVGSSPLQAAPVHITYGYYSVDISPSSTIYTTVLSFNGGQVNFRGFDFTWAPDHTSTSGTFDATFTADPGHVFTQASIFLGDFSWYNQGYQAFDIYWFMSNATYTGAGQFTADGVGTVASVSGGTQGEYHYWNPWAGSGGTANGFHNPFTARDSTLTFPGVRSFSIHLTEGAWGGGEGTFGRAQLSVGAATVPGSPVPEPSTYLAGLSALGMLGLCGWRNRR